MGKALDYFLRTTTQCLYAYIKIFDLKEHNAEYSNGIIADNAYTEQNWIYVGNNETTPNTAVPTSWTSCSKLALSTVL